MAGFPRIASAFGYETGPYAEGSLVLQPVIRCGPCNPNKPCSKPECHDTISPELLAKLTMLRVAGDFKELPEELKQERGTVIYRTFFDENGFYNLKPLNDEQAPQFEKYRNAYRSMWLDDLGGFPVPKKESGKPKSLQMVTDAIEGLGEVEAAAKEGQQLINQLYSLIRNPEASPQKLGTTGDELTELDRKIEQLGFHYPHLGPITRMFIFGKENISGTDASELASQMMGVYQSLERRSGKLAQYF